MSIAEPSAGCPLCGIACGRFPAHIVAERSAFLAFLDADPIRAGHLQVMPRAHFPGFNALPGDLAREMLNFAESLARLQRSVFKVDRVGFLFPGDKAPHAHLHVVPLLSAADVTSWRRKASSAGPAPCAGPRAELAQAAWRLPGSLTRPESMGAMP